MPENDHTHRTRLRQQQQYRGDTMQVGEILADVGAGIDRTSLVRSGA